MGALSRAVGGLPTVPRSLVLGAIIAGAFGVIAGLVIGLNTYTPAAPFAMIELGLPVAFCGALIGLVVGLLLEAAQRVHR